MSPEGSVLGDGTFDRPYDLQSALSLPGYVLPGHTIWLKSGVYYLNAANELVINIEGTPENKVTFRCIPDEWKSGNRATVKGGIRITGNGNLRFQNLVFSFSNPERYTSEAGSNPVGYNPIGAITKLAPYVDVINCLIIDSNSVALGDWESAFNSLNYGNLIHNCGWYSTDRDGPMYDGDGNRTLARYGHGHGFYMQKNPDNTITLNRHNLFLSCFGLTFSAFYTSGVSLDNISMLQNVAFGFSGSLGYVGNDTLLINANVDDNVFWDMATAFGQNELGGNAMIQNNVFSGGVHLSGLAEGLFSGNRVVHKTAGVPITVTRVVPQIGIIINGNDYRTANGVATLNGESVPGIPMTAFQSYGYESDGQYSANIPSANVHHIWPNEYPDDIRIGIVVIENWEGAASDTVDLTSLNLTSGATYRFFNAFNYLGDNPLEYTSDGDDSTVFLNLSGWSMAKPIGTANGVAINEPLDQMPDDLAVFIVEMAQ